jgi:hypothetical protein
METKHADSWLWREQRWRDRNQRTKVKRKLQMRSLRARLASRGYTTEATLREVEGWAEYWMIGYDGPSPYVKTSWALIAEHARIYGLKREPNSRI